MSLSAYNSLKKRVPGALPPLQKLYEWLSTPAARATTFHSEDECQCPLAVFLSAHLGMKIDVGDDDLSHDGLFLCEMPRDYREFVRTFDTAYEKLIDISADDTLELCKSNAREWRITP